MKKIDGNMDTDAELRQRANLALRTETQETPLVGSSPEESVKMLHELRVHQIELEKQNEELRQTQAELEYARQRYFDLYNLAPVGYCTISSRGIVTDANLHATDILGMTRTDMIRQQFSRFICKQDQDTFHLHRKMLLETGAPQSCDLRMIRLNKTVFWTHLTANVCKTGDETVCHVVIVDIQDRKRLESSLSDEKKLLETTLSSISDGVISADKKGQVVFMNRVAEQLTGWSLENAKREPIDKVFHVLESNNKKQVVDIIRHVRNKEPLSRDNPLQLVARDGTTRPIEAGTAPIIFENGMAAGIVLIFSDYSEKMRKQEKIKYLSYHDQLTGLYNRRFFEEELKRLDTERNLPLTVAMGDVNGLKLVNDSFGHIMGDELLVKVANALRKGCRTDDIVARLGGDEFVIILPNTEPAEADRIIERVQTLLDMEKVGALRISISFGHETKTGKEQNIHEILTRTEDFMYRQKFMEHTTLRSSTLDLILRTLFERNIHEMSHAKLVSRLSEETARAMNLKKKDVHQIRIAGLMHDIGKIGIDAGILNKPDKLSRQERKEVERHSEIGYRLLNSVTDFSEISLFVLENHERLNGKGYPRGLKNEEISLQAKIISVADAYATMTGVRPYGIIMSKEKAILELRKNAGIQFDAGVVDVFLEKVLVKEA